MTVEISKEAISKIKNCHRVHRLYLDFVNDLAENFILDKLVPYFTDKSNLHKVINSFLSYYVTNGEAIGQNQLTKEITDMLQAYLGKKSELLSKLKDATGKCESTTKIIDIKLELNPQTYYLKRFNIVSKDTDYENEDNTSEPAISLLKFSSSEQYMVQRIKELIFATIILLADANSMDVSYNITYNNAYEPFFVSSYRLDVNITVKKLAKLKPIKLPLLAAFTAYLIILGKFRRYAAVFNKRRTSQPNLSPTIIRFKCSIYALLDCECYNSRNRLEVPIVE